MSDANYNEFDGRLIDLHLGRLDEAAAAELRARIAGDAHLSAQSDALAGVFAALQQVQVHVSPPPADLAERIRARVRAAGPSLRVHPAVSKAGREIERRRIRLGGLREVVAVAAMVVLTVGLGVPSFMQIRERSQRQACSFNLAQMGRAMQSYATTFGENLPFAGWDEGDTWKPGDSSLKSMPNRRHLYLLAREAQPEWFVCPSAGGVPMPRGLNAAADFPESRNLNYVYQNMAGARPTLKNHADQPILADDNPCFDDGQPLFDMRQRMGWSTPANSNSPSHQWRGQNLLTLDGRVKWTTSPNCGVGGDNIWTLSGVSEYTGREGAVVQTDSHLIK